MFSALSLQKEDIEADIFSNALAASLRPVNYRPVFRGDEALIEDVVGKMRQTIKMMFSQFDALGGGWVRRVAMSIDVAKPDAGRNVLFKERLMTAEYRKKTGHQ